MTNIKSHALIFDYDGVIVNTMPAHVDAWQKAFLRCTNIEIPTVEFYLREGEARERTVFDLFKGISGRAPGRQQTREIIEWRDLYYRAHATRLFPHVRDLLATLQKKHIMLAIVSGNIDVTQELRDRNIHRFFSVVISPAESTRMKPHPAPYLVAVERLQLPRNRCVVV
ncbi:MAG: HAD family phosphatase, partial [Acidobacteriota bacterium]